jgi:hypothetical protein
LWGAAPCRCGNLIAQPSDAAKQLGVEINLNYSFYKRNEISRSDPPEIPEPQRRQLGVSDGVLDRLVAQIALDRARIDAIIRQLVPTAMPQHVGVETPAKFCKVRS